MNLTYEEFLCFSILRIFGFVEGKRKTESVACDIIKEQKTERSRMG